VTAYASAAPLRWIVGSLSYDHVRKEFDTTSVAPTGVFQDRFDTERLRRELRSSRIEASSRT